MSAADRRCQEALALWLRWNSEHQKLSESLYRARERPARIEELLDGLDSLRNEAVAVSEEALSA